MQHDYPGNVRELENIIEQAFVLCRGESIELRHLPPELRPAARSEADDGGWMDLRSMERQLIEAALKRHNGNRTQAARDLGIDASDLSSQSWRCAKGTSQPMGHRLRLDPRPSA